MLSSLTVFLPDFKILLLSSLSSSEQFFFSLKCCSTSLNTSPPSRNTSRSTLIFSFCSPFLSSDPSFCFFNSLYIPSLTFLWYLKFGLPVEFMLLMVWTFLHYNCSHLHNTFLRISSTLSLSSFPFVSLKAFSGEYLQVFQGEIRKVTINFDELFWSCFLLHWPYSISDSFFNLCSYKCTDILFPEWFHFTSATFSDRFLTRASSPESVVVSDTLLYPFFAYL